MPTIQDFRKMLLIHKHRLDDEFELQAESQFHIGEIMVKAQSKYDQAKEKLAYVEARLYKEISEGDEKLSDSKIRARIVLEPEYADAKEVAAVAKYDYGIAYEIHEAWRQRGYSLKGLADLYVANYYSPSDAKGGDEDEYKSNREAAARARAASKPAPQEDAGAVTVRRRTLT